MTKRLAVTPAPGPLEDYAQRFDELFAKRNQREGFRRYLEGLLLPAERNKTLTAIANTEAVVGAQHPTAQRLQWFLSESTLDPVVVNRRRVDLLVEAANTAPNEQGVLVIDETGDRKWGSKTAHVGRQYLGSIGKVDNGVVSVHSLWADEGVYYPLEVEPYTPAHWFEGGRQDPEFRTKPAIALELVKAAIASGIRFRAVVADSFYGDNLGFREGLLELGCGYVLALKPTHSWWHAVDELGSVEALARSKPWDPATPGEWIPITRRFRDGHSEVWWALEAEGGPYGVDKPERLVIVTTDPAQLPELTTWYLVTNLPAPGSSRAEESPVDVADLAEVLKLFGLRIWVEQSYKQVKQSLGWADYQVRSDQAIRRHWQLVCCAFSFCWWALGQEEVPDLPLAEMQQPVTATPSPSVAKVGGKRPSRDRHWPPDPVLARGAASGQGMVGAVHYAVALLERVVSQAPTTPITGLARLGVAR